MASSARTRSDQALPVALRGLLQQRQLTLRRLAELTRQGDVRGVTHGHIANLLTGRDHATLRVLELLAEALEVEPEHFVEYRLAVLRRRLDERAVGLEAASQRYQQLIG